MKRLSLLSSLVMGSALLTGHAFAASQSPSGVQQSNQNQDKQRRAELTYQIVKKWGGHVQEAYRASPKKWAMDMVPLFRASSIDAMKRAANARTFDGMNDVLLQSNNVLGAKGVNTKAFGGTTKLLGDIARDLVYVPITPCRIFDTRLAGGAIAPATARDFDVTVVGTNYAFQGGDATDCSGAGNAGSFAAAVINFTVVNPTSQGFVTAYPLGTTRPLAATMVHAPGALLSNTSIVRLDQGPSSNEMSVYASGGTHLVGDIVGYFTNPAPIALDYVNVFNATATSLPVGGFANVSDSSIAACPAGYTTVSYTWQYINGTGGVGVYNNEVGNFIGFTHVARTGAGDSTITVNAGRRCGRVGNLF